MSGTTTELALPTAVDTDDNADYLTIGLANGLRTVDALFNNVTGHSHGGAHQGGPIGTVPISAIPDGSITSAKIADGTITSADILDGTIATADIADAAVSTIKLAVNAATVTLAAGGSAGSPTTTSLTLVDMTDMTITWTASGGYVLVWLFASVYNQTAGQLVNMAVNRGGVDGPQSSFTSNAINAGSTMSILAAYGPLSGSQTIKGRWGVSSGTAVSPGVARTIIVAEFKR